MSAKTIQQYTSDSLARHKMNAVKSRIQRFLPNEFISHCLSINNAPYKTRIEMLQHLPWIVNLSIKWSAAAINKRRQFRRIDKDKTWNLLQEVYRALDYIPIDLHSREGLDFFVRNTIFQQGTYQYIDYVNNISRQAFIFNNLDPLHGLKTIFQDKAGITINEFNALSAIIIAMSMKGNTIKISVDSFAPMFSSYPKEKIINFLSVISISADELPSFAKENILTSPLKEYYSPTSFLYKPFIRDNDNYIQIHPAVTVKSLQHFIYDYLRKDNPESFMDKFGSVFEDAIKKIIAFHQTKFVAEEELIKALAPGSKVVDFIIQESNANIFIDAKGVELNQKGMITLRSGDISSAIKSSVLKTLKQALTVNEHIHKKEIEQIKAMSNAYIICVTYKDLLLGYGKMIYESFAKWEMDKIFEDYDPAYLIPYENIFCLSYEEFEYLLANCSEYGREISEVLDYAVLLNKDPLTASFFFKKHLEAFFKSLKPSSIVHQAGIRVFDELSEKIPELRKRFTELYPPKH